MLIQPLFLAILISITQYNPVSPTQVYFFAVVVSIWLGLNNAIRDLVRQRKQYLRERLVGLKPPVFFGAKCAIYSAIGMVQPSSLWGQCGCHTRWTLPNG